MLRRRVNSKTRNVRVACGVGDGSKHVLYLGPGVLPKTRQAWTRDGRTFLGVTRACLTQDFGGTSPPPAATQPPRQPSACDSCESRDAIDNRSSPSYSAIGDIRRATTVPNIRQRQPPCLLPLVSTYVCCQLGASRASAQLAEASIGFSDAWTNTDGMSAGPPMGCPGYRRLLRPLQPGLDIVA